MGFASLKRKRLIPIVLVAILLCVTFAVVRFLQWIYVDRYRVEWSSYVSSTLIVRGVITDVALNRKVSGFITWHTFPALITLNVTEVVWVNDGVWDEKNRTVITVGYDFPEMPHLTVGGNYEVRGFWVSVTDSPYSYKLIVAPSIGDSYIKPF